MKLSSTARDLYEEIAKLTIIDAHEHLPPEADYLARPNSGANMFSHYIRRDLQSVGLSSELFQKLLKDDMGDVHEWWPTLKPYWENVKNTSYARALKITARDLWGIDEIGDDTIEELAAKVQADSTPGIYRRTLQDACNIRTSIACGGPAGFPDDPGFVNITYALGFVVGNPEAWRSIGKEADREIRTLDDAADALQTLRRSHIDAGAVGFKARVSDFTLPDAKKAEAEFNAMMKSPQER